MMNAMKMCDCPRFERCSAPICPLDPDWELRVYRKSEPTCFYLREYVKSGAKTRFQGCTAIQIFEVIQQHLEALCHRYAPLCRALERAKRTGSKTGPRRTVHASPVLGLRGRAVDRDRANRNPAKLR
jgi:hypothetical protein